jgi:hypothetical protein
MTKLRVRCTGVHEGKLNFKQVDKRYVYVERKNAGNMERIFIYGKQVEILADVTMVIVADLRTWHLRLEQIYRSRLLDPVSFKGKSTSLMHYI